MTDLCRDQPLMDCMKDLIKDASTPEKQDAVTRAIKALATAQGDTGFITKMDGRLKTIELQTLRAENPLLKSRRNAELELSNAKPYAAQL